MSKFDQLLSYKSNCGRQFELLTGEKLAIDGMDFTSSWGSMCSYVMFITNKRIILRQSNVSWNSRGGESAFHADVRTINWEDVKLIKFIHRPWFGGSTILIQGTFKDFSVKEKEGDDYEVGSISPGFGGLEYSTLSGLYDGFTRALKALSDEYGFGLYLNGKNKAWTNVSKERAHEKQKSITKNRLAVCGALVALGAAGLGTMWLLSPNSPLKQTEQVPVAIEELNDEATTEARPERPTQGIQEKPPVTIQNRTKQSTCLTSAFAGSDGTKLKRFDCRVRSLTTSRGLMIFIEWSDGVESQFLIRDDKTAMIYGDGSTLGINAEWWEHTHNGVEMISIESNKGAQSWINLNDALDANPNSY